MPNKFKVPAPAVLSAEDRKALYKKPVTAEQLLGLLEDDHNHDFFISLAGGLARSSKTIYKCYTKGGKPRYDIFNDIDGSWQTLKPEQLLDPKGDRTNIGEAISKNALIYWGK